MGFLPSCPKAEDLTFMKIDFQARDLLKETENKFDIPSIF
jgi:hypothetical protein